MSYVAKKILSLQSYLNKQRFVKEATYLNNILIKLANEVHTVRSGENLTLIARKYFPDLSDDEGVLRLLASNPNLTANIHPGDEIVIASSENKVIHTVRRGDTLSEIAEDYGVTISALESVNPELTSNIFPGDEIEIPAGAVGSKDSGEAGIVHTVTSGDTLSEIAEVYRVTMGEIKAINPGLTSNIHPGDEIKIPASGKLPPVRSVSGREAQILDVVLAEGMDVKEAAQFMAQAKKESASFTRMHEGDIGRNKHNYSGGGEIRNGVYYATYYGRGPFQLTHDYNYRSFGEADGVGDEYIDNPDLVADPEIGTRAALWFWDRRVRTIYQGDWDNTKGITRRIRGSSSTWQERNRFYIEYQRIIRARIDESDRIASPGVQE
jgi:LysM repeat protein